jgi:hypothetical protein
MNTKLSNSVRDKIISVAVDSLIKSSRDKVIKEATKDFVSLMDEVYKGFDLEGTYKFKDFIRFSKNIRFDYDAFREIDRAINSLPSGLGYSYGRSIQASREYPCFKGNSYLEFPARFSARVKAVIAKVLKSALDSKSVYLTVRSAVYGVSTLQALVTKFPELKPFTKGLDVVSGDPSGNASAVSALFKKAT